MNEGFADATEGKVYYTKDSYAKVSAYYLQIYGNPITDEGSNYFKVRALIENKADDSSVMAFNVNDKSKLVQVKDREVFDNYAVSQALANLRRAYIDMNTTTALKLDPMTFANDPKVRRAIEKYAYLLRRFYSRTPEPSNSGTSQYKGLEEILYEQYFKEPENERMIEMKKMQDEYLAFVKQGDLKQAMVMSEKMNVFTTTSSVDPEEAYYNIIEYLRELEKLSFVTKILIYD